MFWSLKPGWILCTYSWYFRIWPFYWENDFADFSQMSFDEKSLSPNKSQLFSIKVKTVKKIYCPIPSMIFSSKEWKLSISQLYYSRSIYWHLNSFIWLTFEKKRLLAGPLMPFWFTRQPLFHQWYKPKIQLHNNIFMFYTISFKMVALKQSKTPINNFFAS